MPRSTQPKYRRQRRKSGADLAFVELDGKRHYLGAYDSDESRERYHALLAKYEANGRQIVPTAEVDDPTISELLYAFYQFAQHHYVKDGEPTSELHLMRAAMGPLRQLYGSTKASEFRPSCVRAVRQEMISRGWARTTVNGHIGRIRRIFRWAVEHEVVAPSVLEGISAVRGLTKGRSDAKETEPVKPVPEADIDAIRPFVSAQVEALIDLQLLTGARPGELISMRPTDLDTTGSVWTYTPQSHKTSHHGHDRLIYLGPKAQAIIEPYLTRDLSAFMFSPTESEAERRTKQHRERRTPLSCGNRPSTHAHAQPLRAPRDHFTVDSYRQAIQRACDKAFPPPEHLARQRVPARGRKHKAMRLESTAEWRDRLGPERWSQLRQWQRDHRWHPHQLRHNAATNLRREHGIDVAQTVLGHRLGSTITELYAEQNRLRAKAAIKQLG